MFGMQMLIKLLDVVIKARCLGGGGGRVPCCALYQLGSGVVSAVKLPY